MTLPELDYHEAIVQAGKETGVDTEGMYPEGTPGAAVIASAIWQGHFVPEPGDQRDLITATTAFNAGLALGAEIGYKKAVEMMRAQQEQIAPEL